ncbi:MAG: Tn3 family transposase [Pseudonocardiaceae bacterium]
MIADNDDPEEQEKILKFSTLLTNAVIFHTTLDMMTSIRELVAEGWESTLEDLATRASSGSAGVALGCWPEVPLNRDHGSLILGRSEVGVEVDCAADGYLVGGDAAFEEV